MKMLWIDKKIKYDGSQLHSLFAYLEHKVLGDSIVSFEGPCDVDFKHMVDGEDLLARSPIRSNNMVHFIIEKFGQNLFSGVLLQRLITTIARDTFYQLTQQQATLKREGDDLFIGDQKLSISIATLSPVSALIHFAVNITTEGTPVKTVSLEQYGILPREFATQVMSKVSAELQSIDEACCKVRWVK